jgi:hypothetical protein
MPSPCRPRRGSHRHGSALSPLIPLPASLGCHESGRDNQEDAQQRHASFRHDWEQMQCQMLNSASGQ